jgi:hypothetical protein
MPQGALGRRLGLGVGDESGRDRESETARIETNPGHGSLPEERIGRRWFCFRARRSPRLPTEWV